MTRADALVFHRLRCHGCDHCERRAEDRKTDTDGPIDTAEESRRADTWERYMQGGQL